jgi:hypothetical protein
MIAHVPAINSEQRQTTSFIYKYTNKLGHEKHNREVGEDLREDFSIIHQDLPFQECGFAPGCPPTQSLGEPFNVPQQG